VKSVQGKCSSLTLISSIFFSLTFSILIQFLFVQ
jgi:hypothetical protein